MHPLVIALAACTTPLPDDTPYVDEPRVLAVQVDPPEVEAGQDVVFTALYADRTGALPDAPVDWAFCARPKPLAELGPVAASCLDPDSPDLVPIGAGPVVTATVPEDACSRFGPNPPPPEPDQPAGRPADPDPTGGYFQPALAFLDGVPTLVQVRVRCGLANVSQEDYIAWNQGYRSNERPAVDGFFLSHDGEAGIRVPIDGEGEPVEVAPGEALTLDASWPECPADIGCDGAEDYVVYDVETTELVPRREAVSATWFATGGSYTYARNGRTGDDPATGLADLWTAPDEPGDVWLAVVLRDERGGVGFSSYRLTVAP